jgi:CrcB protein
VPGRDIRELAAIAAGGAVGALLRAALVEAGGNSGRWPWATFAVNIVGTFLLGYFATRLQERLPVSAYRRPLLGTGFCGALTTFSTMQVELLSMLDAHRYGLAIAYAAISLVLGYVSMHLATSVVRRVRSLA